jgi:hypothetical protein
MRGDVQGRRRDGKSVADSAAQSSVFFWPAPDQSRLGQSPNTITSNPVHLVAFLISKVASIVRLG